MRGFWFVALLFLALSVPFNVSAEKAGVDGVSQVGLNAASHGLVQLLASAEDEGEAVEDEGEAVEAEEGEAEDPVIEPSEDAGDEAAPAEVGSDEEEGVPADDEAPAEE